MHIAFIGLGSNLGDRQAMIAAALARLRGAPQVRVSAVSSLHETAPLGGPAGQPMYLNAAARIETTLPPHALLQLLLDIERDLGRQRREHWGPRTIDLDLLLFDDVVLDDPKRATGSSPASDGKDASGAIGSSPASADEPTLILPHPRLHERQFVLAPLAEIAPDVVHPVLGRTIAELLGERYSA